MMNRILAAASALALLLGLTEGFAPSPIAFRPTSTLAATTAPFGSTECLAAATLDPTTVLTDTFSGVLGTPIILAVPILAAFGLAGILAFLLISYANPTVDDE